MIPIADPVQTGAHVSAFIKQGYTHFRGLYRPVQVEMFHRLYERAVAEWRFTTGTEDRPDGVGNLLERFRARCFPL